MRRPIIAVAGIALALAACSREPEPSAPVVNDEVPAEEPAPPPPTPPPPPPLAEPAREEPPADLNDMAVEEPPLDESAQTLEDADAVGLTTRARRGEEDGQGAGNQQDGFDFDE